MLLFLEIFLTIAAWRKGYGIYALLPMGLTFLIGFFIGATSAEPVGSDDVFSYIWIDILAIIALAIMYFSGSDNTIDEKKEESPDLTFPGNQLPEH